MQKWIKFTKSFLINGLLYGVLMYLIGSVSSLKQFIFSVLVFGLFMAVFNTFIFPIFIKNKIKKQ